MPKHEYKLPANELKAIREHIKENEGEVFHPYLDTKGKVTIGVGFLADDEETFTALDLQIRGNGGSRPATVQEKKHAFQKMHAERERLKGKPALKASRFKDKTNVFMADDVIDTKLDREINTRAGKARSLIGANVWDKSDLGAKKVAVDLHYATGNLKAFPNFVKAVKVGNTQMMAEESLFYTDKVNKKRDLNRLQRNIQALSGMSSEEAKNTLNRMAVDPIDFTLPDAPTTGGPVTIGGVPKGAHITAGTFRAATQLDRVKERLSTLGMSAPTMGDALQSPRGRKAIEKPGTLELIERGLGVLAKAIGEPGAGLARSPIRAPKGKAPKTDAMTDRAAYTMVASILDGDVIGRLMQTPAYQKQSHPLRKAVATTVQDYFKQTYPGPARVDAAGRITAGAMRRGAWDVKRDIKKDMAVRDKSHALEKVRRETLKAAIDNALGDEPTAKKEDNTLKRATRPTRGSLETAKSAKRSLLGTADEPLGRAPTVAEPRPGTLASNDVAIKRAVARNVEQIRQNERKAALKSEQAKSLLKQVVDTTDKVAAVVKKERYVSDRRKDGSSTGGVGRDNYGREVGAWGQFTRDVVGRGDGSASAGNTRVICTELVRQGLMAPELQRLDIAFTLKHLSPITVRGYHFLAVPYVRLMRRSQMATRLMEPIARWRAEEIAYQMGARPNPNWPGKAVRLTLEPLCWFSGAVLGLFGGCVATGVCL